MSKTVRLEDFADDDRTIEEMFREMPPFKFDFPKIDPPKFDLSWATPGINFAALMPEFVMPKIDMNPFAALLNSQAAEIREALGRIAVPRFEMPMINTALWAQPRLERAELLLPEMPESAELLVDEEHMYPSEDSDVPRRSIGF